MGDFESRMDKWGEHEVSSWAADFKDAIVNKGRVQRERKAAHKRAMRRARWKRSWLGRFTEWVKRWVLRLIMLAIFGFLAMAAFAVGRVMLAFFGVFN